MTFRVWLLPLITLVLISSAWSQDSTIMELSSIESAQKMGPVQVDGQFVFVTLQDTVYMKDCDCDSLANKWKNKCRQKPRKIQENKVEYLSNKMNPKPDSLEYVYVKVPHRVFLPQCNCPEVLAAAEQPCTAEQNKAKELKNRHSIAISPMALLTMDFHVRYLYSLKAKHHLVADAGSLISAQGGYFSAGYVYSFNPLEKDGWFIGSELGWTSWDAKVNNGQDKGKEIQWVYDSFALKIYMGKRYQWKSGFFIDTRIGPAIPLYKDSKFLNSYGLSDKDYTDVKDFGETQEIMGMILGGSGLAIGWYF